MEDEKYHSALPRQSDTYGYRYWGYPGWLAKGPLTRAVHLLSLQLKHSVGSVSTRALELYSIESRSTTEIWSFR